MAIALAPVDLDTAVKFPDVTEMFVAKADPVGSPIEIDLTEFKLILPPTVVRLPRTLRSTPVVELVMLIEPLFAVRLAVLSSCTPPEPALAVKLMEPLVTTALP